MDDHARVRLEEELARWKCRAEEILKAREARLREHLTEQERANLFLGEAFVASVLAKQMGAPPAVMKQLEGSLTHWTAEVFRLAQANPEFLSEE